MTVKADSGKFQLTPSTGGLVTGLSSLRAIYDTLWIGWHGYTGSYEHASEDELLQLTAENGMIALTLSQDEVQGYYNDFSNGAVWPLYHYQVDKMPLTITGWAEYQNINEKFCDAIVEAYQEGDFIWVQDYHLQLLPAMIRKRIPSAKIGFFLHIPFPSSEIFRVFPWRKQIIEGLLGADIIGFHTHSYVRHFQSSLLRILGIDSYADSITHEGRSIKLGAFPLGVDVNKIETESHESKSELAEALNRIRSEKTEQTILLSIDRLDYTKGLPRRILAFEQLLEDNPDLVGRVTFVQIASPSRDQVTAYENYKALVEGLVGRVNGRFGLPGHQPIHYVSRNFSQREILSLYPIADVMVVTPLRDGMNLVAKEFVAARSDCEGVLILSEFAGAAEELGEAVLVNPYDISDSAQGMLTAIQMTKAEKKTRMTALRDRVLRFDSSEWAKRYIEFLQKEALGNLPANYLRPQELSQKSQAGTKKVLFLDYDGTLFPIVRIPSLAVPDQKLHGLLAQLSTHTNFEVHIVSGRPQKSLDEWFGQLPISLHAEHGATSRSSTSDEWFPAIHYNETKDWKLFVRSVLNDYTKNTPGSFIEEKVHSLAWHYRMADPELGQKMSNELRLHGRETFAPLGLELLPGKLVLEVRQAGVNKGTVVRRAIQNLPASSQVIVIGDDVTDEDMFEAAPKDALTIAVGNQASNSKFRLKDSGEVRQFLTLLLKAENTQTPAIDKCS